MVTTREEEQLLSLYQLFDDNHFAEGQRIILDQLRKKQNNSLYIAFCGHYSSGKSTFINYLFGENILPTSPIPTSGNIVQITKGIDEIIIHKSNGKLERYSDSLDEKQLQSLCMNGEDILKIELKSNEISLEEAVTLIDTPGIDSTDTIHQITTASIIPIVDIVYYLVDYNHVNSEINIQFVREMKEQRKYVILIINQIDKHNEDEISFDEYRKGIIALWNKFGINEIFFISLKNISLKDNELSDVRNHLKKIIRSKEELIRKNDKLLLQNIGEKFNCELLNEYGSVLSLDELQLELMSLRRNMMDIELDYKKNVDAVINNVYLITYEVRELIRCYLESLNSSYKTTLFNRKKKQKDLESRMIILYDFILQQTNAQLDNQLKKVVTSFIEDKDIYELESLFGKQLIEETIVEGAIISHTYVLQYATDLEYKIKMMYKKYYYDYFLQMKDKLNRSSIKREQELIGQIDRRKLIDKKLLRIQKILQGEVYGTNITIDELLNIPYTVTKFENQELFRIEKQEKEIPKILMNGDVLAKSKEFEKLLELNPIFSQMLQLLRAKRRRIEERIFTVVLFGAFSAGKSSLINGLLGEKILPSSPNPTTSVITYVKVPDKLNLNLTAKIFKGNSEKTIPIDELESIIANEEIAKVIEKVEIYYDCIWTRMGIVFIDTPGINSINKRHSEVAFSFMKEADVIMYVSYYHHSFSKSDKEFLYQLGRVKESSFEDNIIFVLNAIDLAEDDAEISMVQQYVVDQLKKSGIEDPTIFGVSSKYFGKKSKFNQQFIDYLNNEMIHRLLEQSLVTLFKLMKSTYQHICFSIDKFDIEQGNREFEVTKLGIQLEKDINVINTYDIAVLNKEMKFEFDELLFYVKKRLVLKCREVFIECFHPSSIKVKSDMQEGLYDFIQTMENSITQEVLATTLRIEKYIVQLLKREITQLQPELVIEFDINFITPELKEIMLPLQQFKSKNNFKNARLFFEGNGKEIMLEEFLQIFGIFLDKYLQETYQLFQLYYEKQLLNQWNILKELMFDELRHNFEHTSQLIMINDIEPMKQLQLKMEKIFNT